MSNTDLVSHRAFRTKTNLAAAETETMAPPPTQNVKEQVESADSRDQPWKRVLKAFEKENGAPTDETDIVDTTRAVGRCEQDVGPGAS